MKLSVLTSTTSLVVFFVFVFFLIPSTSLGRCPGHDGWNELQVLPPHTCSVNVSVLSPSLELDSHLHIFPHQFVLRPDFLCVTVVGDKLNVCCLFHSFFLSVIWGICISFFFSCPVYCWCSLLVFPVYSADGNRCLPVSFVYVCFSRSIMLTLLDACLIIFVYVCFCVFLFVLYFRENKPWLAMHICNDTKWWPRLWCQ